MQDKVVGFYWSLPVPWAGFTQLDPDIEIATKQSRTIAYQRRLVHDYAKRNGLTIICESTFLEVDPDRGSKYIEGALQKTAKVCEQHEAELLYVDFSGLSGWRSHQAMQDWLMRHGIGFPIEAKPLAINGKLFDPTAHFSEWRVKQWEWTSGKHERVAKARARALELQANGKKKPAIARLLNEEGIRSATGKDWTADSLRKMLDAEL